VTIGRVYEDLITRKPLSEVLKLAAAYAEIDPPAPSPEERKAREVAITSPVGVAA
jgi:hypothetical protein